MSIKLKNLFFHPDTFFAEITYEWKNHFIPFLFVVLAGFIGSMVLFLFSGGYPVGMIVEIMAIPFAIWICATVVIFIVARALSGSGSFLRPFRIPVLACSHGSLRLPGP